jgi:hypothetical protein
MAETERNEMNLTGFGLWPVVTSVVKSWCNDAMLILTLVEFLPLLLCNDLEPY